LLHVKRAFTLARAHDGDLPQHLPPSAATATEWYVDIPAWCEDQRNLMSCPADDAALVVKSLNSKAPAVLLDLEDSLVNERRYVSAGTETANSPAPHRTRPRSSCASAVCTSASAASCRAKPPRLRCSIWRASGTASTRRG
jgi:hypothetical protein